LSKITENCDHNIDSRLEILFQVVGSQARILYSDQEGRVAIALAFNEAVKSGKLKV
jgi:urocanate hydratase